MNLLILAIIFCVFSFLTIIIAFIDKKDYFATGSVLLMLGAILSFNAYITLY